MPPNVPTATASFPSPGSIAATLKMSSKSPILYQSLPKKWCANCQVS